MWIGNVMLVILNLPLIGIWVSMLRVLYRLLFPAILIFCWKTGEPNTVSNRRLTWVACSRARRSPALVAAAEHPERGRTSF